jgi:hypothetical protein
MRSGKTSNSGFGVRGSGFGPAFAGSRAGSPIADRRSPITDHRLQSTSRYFSCACRGVGSPGGDVTTGGRPAFAGLSGRALTRQHFNVDRRPVGGKQGCEPPAGLVLSGSQLTANSSQLRRGAYLYAEGLGKKINKIRGFINHVSHLALTVLSHFRAASAAAKKSAGFGARGSGLGSLRPDPGHGRAGAGGARADRPGHRRDGVSGGGGESLTRRRGEMTQEERR